MANPLNSSSPTALPPTFQISVGPTLGADFIGCLLSGIFYGITVLQTILYFGTYDKDPLPLKLLVGALWVLDTLSLILFTHGTYTYLVTNYANPIAASGIVWSIDSEPMVTAVIALVVHLFLAYRIHILGRSKIWTSVATAVATVSLFPFAIGIYTTWLVNSGSQSIDALGELRWVAIAGDTSSSAIDLTIVLVICYELYRGNTKIKSTQKLVYMLCLYVISSGMITTLINMTTLITYLASPNTLVFQIFAASGSKAYVNTLMATLNIRNVVRSKNTPTVITGSTCDGSNTLQFRATRNPSASGTLQPSDQEYDIPLAEASGKHVKGMV